MDAQPNDKVLTRFAALVALGGLGFAAGACTNPAYVTSRRIGWEG